MTETKIIDSLDFEISNKSPFFLIAGPCQIESKSHTEMMAEKIGNIADKLNINFIFKSSFDKANRTSIKRKRGIGLEKSLEVFANIKAKFNIPVLTDIHTESQVKTIANSGVVDVIQIPAFLCRQTDLLKAAAESNLMVNVKKGQFLAPWDMKNIVEKLEYFGTKKNPTY